MRGHGKGGHDMCARPSLSKKNKIRHNAAWCKTQNGRGMTRARARARIDLPLMSARSVGHLYTYINATAAC